MSSLEWEREIDPAVVFPIKLVLDAIAESTADAAFIALWTSLLRSRATCLHPTPVARLDRGGASLGSGVAQPRGSSTARCDISVKMKEE
jgi:hypothetical protein